MQAWNYQRIKKWKKKCYLSFLSFQNYIMSNYKLIYFNIRGRAEIIRYIFAYLDIKYEDHRIEQADWPKIKPSKYHRSFRLM